MENVPPHVLWEHVGRKPPHYVIYPATALGEAVLPYDVVLVLPCGERTDRLVQLIADTFDTLILARGWERGEL